MTTETLGPKQLNEHARAIGFVCIYFAELESALTQLVGRMSDLKGETLDLFLNQIDLRQKIKRIKEFAVSTKAPDEWCEDLNLVLLDVENHIMPTRNRYVHDGWRVTMLDDVVLRRVTKMIVAKRQAGKPTGLTMQEFVRTTAADIWQLSKDIVAVRDALLILDDGYHSLLFKEPAARLPQHIRDQLTARHATVVAS